MKAHSVSYVLKYFLGLLSALIHVSWGMLSAVLRGGEYRCRKNASTFCSLLSRNQSCFYITTKSLPNYVVNANCYGIIAE